MCTWRGRFWVLCSLLPVAILSSVWSGGTHAHDLAGIDRERQQERQTGESGASLNLSRPIDGLPSTQALAIVLGESAVAGQRTLRPYLGGTLSVFHDFEKWNAGSTLSVCFYQFGSEATKRAISIYAKRWSEYGNIQFDFGLEPDFRLCKPNDGVHIRITFDGVGHSSLIGKRAIGSDKRNEATMSLAGFDLAGSLSSDRFRWIVMHEFGHAIGLRHEQQNPSSACMSQYDVEAVARAYGWSDTRAIENLSTIQVSSASPSMGGYRTGMVSGAGTITFTAFDKHSVMQYDIPKKFFYDPPGECYVEVVQTEPSRGDQEAIARAYPKGKSGAIISQQNRSIDRVIARIPQLTSQEREALLSFKRFKP